MEMYQLPVFLNINFNCDQGCKGMQVSVTMVSGDEEEKGNYI